MEVLCKSVVDISHPVGMSTIQSVRDCFVQLLRSFYRNSVELLVQCLNSNVDVIQAVQFGYFARQWYMDSSEIIDFG